MHSIVIITTILLLQCISAREIQPQFILKRANVVDDHRQEESKPPSFPSSYKISYSFTIPYLAEIQPDPIRYTVTFYRDASSVDEKKVRMETLGGANTMIAIQRDAEYELVPRIDKQHCIVFPGGGAAKANALPDLSGWEYIGKDFYKDNPAHVWQYKKRIESSELHTKYTMYVSYDGRPLFLHMKGQELIMGSHYGEYTVEYLDFVPGVPDASLFDPPSLCSDSKGEWSTTTPLDSKPQNMIVSSAGMRMLNMIPIVKYGGEHTAYDQFLATHGSRRMHSSLEEYRVRQEIFQKNLDMIENHNRNASKSYSMAMNHFGDWTKQEYLAVMFPNHGEKKVEKKPRLEKHEYPYKPLVDVSLVPGSIDWRGTGADTGIKDQALCGSCWSFGAVGAMESAYFRATGKSKRFSEQQVMDCTWGYEPDNSLCARGCDGGSAWAGIGHIVEAGGISMLEEYQYLGITDYCRENVRPKVGKFKGYARIPSGDDAALMEAIYSRGPVAVSLDASQDSFSFYSGGIYEEPNCSYEYDDLDHAMVAVGYGTDDKGTAYWIIKNSWAKFWGEDGYIRVSMNVQRGCGASTDALYAIIADKKELE